MLLRLKLRQLLCLKLCHLFVHPCPKLPTCCVSSIPRLDSSCRLVLVQRLYFCLHLGIQCLPSGASAPRGLDASCGQLLLLDLSMDAISFLVIVYRLHLPVHLRHKRLPCCSSAPRRLDTRCCLLLCGYGGHLSFQLGLEFLSCHTPMPR